MNRKIQLLMKEYDTAYSANSRHSSQIVSLRGWTITLLLAYFGLLQTGDSEQFTLVVVIPTVLILGGFFVLEPQIFDYIEGDETVWELQPMERLAQEQQLSAFRHSGFWRPMDTLRDKIVLEEMWEANKAPWKIWNE